jgi:hypothetical protein
MADIKLYKLTSSEEIMCTVVSTSDGIQLIKDAVLLIYRQAEGGNMSVGFAPFMPYAEGAIALNDTAISSIGDPKKDLIVEYNRIFGAGIVVASANDTAFKAK